MRYDVFKNGQRCKECYFNRRRLNFEHVKQKIEEEKYKLLSTKYNTNQDLLDVECDKKHIFKITYACFQQGSRCSICWYIKNKQYGLDKRLSYTFIKQSIENEGYKLLSDYDNCRQKLIIECDKEHVYEVIWSNFKSGTRCPKCQFKTEKIVIEFLQNKKIKTISQFKLLNDTKKYDILCKDYNIIIEIDGGQHFKDMKFFKSTVKENQENDKNKMVKAMEQGYSFIRIFQEDIWNDKIDWKNLILDNLKIRYKPIVLYFSSIETLYNNHQLQS